MSRSSFLQGGLEWIYGEDPPAQCPECAFEWNCTFAEALETIGGGPDAIAVSLANKDGMIEQSDGSWNATAYVWHLTDLARSWSERWVQIRQDPGSKLVGFDPDGLATARNYRQLPTAPAVWAVRSAVVSLLEETSLLEPESEFLHGDWGPGTVADAMRWLAHEFHHHSKDIHARAD